MQKEMPIPFDLREGIIYYNGNFVEWKEAKLHVLTHALHYGSSCFEGLRIYDGKIFKNLEHAKRLKISAEMMDFEISKTAEEIAQICSEVCVLNNIMNGYIRPIAWRGSKQMQVSAQNSDINLAVASWNWPNYSIKEKKDGINLIEGMYKRMSPECGPVSAKAGGLYVASTLVKHDAERRGFNDALMLDYRNYVAESSTSNVFFVINNQIHTPIADCFLNGITRQTIIELSKKLGYKVIERHIKLDELASATDAFLTGTAAELTKIASVTSRDMKIVYKFKESKISSHLLQEYQNLVK